MLISLSLAASDEEPASEDEPDPAEDALALALAELKRPDSRILVRIAFAPRARSCRRRRPR